MIRRYLSIFGLCLVLLTGCTTPFTLVSGEVWRTNTATQSTYERVLSFSELQILAAKYPYWEPLDSESLARVNADLKLFRPHKFDLRAINKRMPGYLDTCKLADRDPGRWFNYPVDSIVRHSPFKGDREAVQEQECLCLLTNAAWMLRGKDRHGRQIQAFLGVDSGNLAFLYVGGRYYAHRWTQPSNGLPIWFRGWNPAVFPAPLPTWPGKSER